MKRVLVVFVSLILVLSISVVGAASAQDERATGSQVIFLGVSGTSDCSHLVPQVYVGTTESMYLAATAIYEDQIVGDAFVPANYPGGVIGTATLNYVNNRGRAPIDVWPLTPGKKVEYFLTLFTLDLQPVYEARAVFASCDATTFTSTTHGPAYNLLENHSFEAPGESGGVLDADLAAFWKGKNTFNDSRVCAARAGDRPTTKATAVSCSSPSRAPSRSSSRHIRTLSGRRRTSSICTGSRSRSPATPEARR